MIVHGVSISPNVRKVTIALQHKGIEYDNEIVRPGTKTPEFLKISPLGYIPAITDGDLNLSDSVAIIEYLEERYPEVSLMPSDIADRATARFLSDYGLTKIFPQCRDVMMNIMKPDFATEPRNDAQREEALNVGLHEVFDYLETIAPAGQFFFDDKLTIADIAIVAPCVSAMYGNFKLDPARHPKMAAYIDRLLKAPAVAKCLEIEMPLCEMVMDPEVSFVTQ